MTRPGLRWAERAGLIATAVMAVLALSGCLVAEVGVEVGSDGAGMVAIEVYPSDQFRDQLRKIDLEDLEQLSSSVGAQVEISEIGTVGRRGYRIEVPFEDYRVLATAGEGGVRFGGVDLRLFNSFSLVEVDGSWTLAAELRPLDEIVTLLRQVLRVGTVDNQPEVNLSVSLPGRVVRSNSDVQERGTARWELDFASPVNPANSVTPLQMRTEPVPLVTPAQLVLIGAGAAVVVGFVLVAVTSGRSRRSGGRRRRRKGGSGTGWSKQPVDAPKADQSVVAPPLPWQTYKPGEEPAGTIPPPALAPLPTSPGAPDAAEQKDSPTAAPTADEPSRPPAATAVPSEVPEGWYPDPEDPTRLRWWDGSDWSGHTSDWV